MASGPPDPSSLGINQAATSFAILASQRTEMLYPVLDTELDQFSMLSSGAVLFFSLAGWFSGMASNWAIEVAINPNAPAVPGMVIAGFGLVAAVFGGAGVLLLCKRKTLASKIKSKVKRTPPRDTPGALAG